MNKTYFQAASATEREMKAFTQIIFRRQMKRSAVLRFICTTVVLILAVSVWLMNETTGARVLSSAVIFIDVISLISTAISVKSAAKINMERFAGVTTVITEESICTAADDYRSEIAWRSVKDVVEADEGFIISTARGGVILLPRSSMTAMVPIPEEGGAYPGATASTPQIDVLSMIRGFIERMTSKRIERASAGKRRLLTIISLALAAAILILTVAVDNFGLANMKYSAGGYSITLPVNMEFDKPEVGGTLSVWNDDISVYNYLDETEGVREYFGYVPTAKEYLTEFYGAIDVKYYTLDNGTECIVCSYDNDDCFYIRAVTPGSDGFWTTVMIGWQKDRAAHESICLGFLNTIEVD